MLSSITPLGERGRHRRWGATATLYVTGSVAGGAAAGGLLGLLGAAVPGLPPPGAVAAVVVAALCLLGAATDLGLFGLRLPTIHRQVNEDWLGTYRGWVVGLGYGAQLGVGAVTIVTTAAVYLTLALAAVSGSPRTGLVIGATFGLARAMPVLALRRVTTPALLGLTHRRMERWAPAAHRTVVWLQALGAMAVLVAR